MAKSDVEKIEAMIKDTLTDDGQYPIVGVSSLAARIYALAEAVKSHHDPEYPWCASFDGHECPQCKQDREALRGVGL